MKILILVHVFNNYGGILNWTEDLICGLRENGHTVNFVQAKPSTKPPKPVDTELVPMEYARGEGTKLPVHQGKGWISPYYSFLNAESVKQYVDFANKHDIVIHGSIFGFANQESEQNTTWLPMITEVKAKQVVVIHDGNLKRNYPWIYKFRQHFAALACVHPAAVKSTDFFDTPRNMILNPFDLKDKLTEKIDWDQRENTLISPQTFKSMKHVESLVAAVPYIKGRVIVAGDGIERSYMTSPDKCKPAYFATIDNDPDVTPDRLNKKIWDNALASNPPMTYLGFISPAIRDKYLKRIKFLVDSSWSVGYGEHFNRTLFETMIQGAIPIAVNYGVSDNAEGNGTLLKAGVNYLMLEKDFTPKQYGEKVNEYLNIPKHQAYMIINNNLVLLEQFDRRKIAKQYVDLACGKDAGFFKENKVGAAGFDPKAVAKSEENWAQQFQHSVTTSLEEFF
jgi:glycosyltransferase involved in cell wall biosynthesis